MNDVNLTSVPESIAVIGMSGRFPKARSIDEFWRNLRDGVECISSLTAEELTAAGGDPEWLQDPGFVNAGGILEDMDMFDASFFGFSARDAEIMDPQHRVFLECAVHCLDDAGYNPETYPGLIGVFAGESMSSYVFDLYANGAAVGRLDDFQIGVGNEKDHLATQVSYKLDLRGPSMAVQTACSTSLVAVSMACQSLLSYQCDMALAGGVAADVLTSRGYQYQPGGILSPDGHCRVFDAGANGTVVGNGVGIVALKRLSEAVAARDRIRAVIRGFALNNDGSQKVGYTAPSVEGQAQVIAMAMAVAQVEPGTFGYIEAHGTGTELGDPIEIAALRQVFDQRTKRKRFCMIGSVKSNIGHLDAAAGIASLIKTILALEHEAVPPSLHFTRANPKADFESGPFYVPTELTEWKRGGHVRRAGVSCFGIGGTNAHVVVEEAPTLPRSHESRPCCVLKLSARSSVALEAMTDNLAGYLAEHPYASLTDVAYTLDVGRKRFKHRRAVVCHGMTPDDARRALAERDPQSVFAATCEVTARPVFFMFPGQGTQDVGMALAVYRSQPAFREQLDRCAEMLQPHVGLDLRDLLYPTADRYEEAAHALGRTMFTQPALFAIEYALAKLWMSWGIRPSAMIGHSIGEYVAACLAGVFSLEDALALVASRGQLMDAMPPGAMLAVALRESDARHYLDNGVSLAAVNGPSACALSGPPEAMEWLARHLDDSGIRHQRLHTSRAFHSGMMDPVVGPFVGRVRSVRLQAPRIPFQSNVTGDWITPEAAVDPDYWGTQLRQTVRFADGLAQLSRIEAGVFLELGPRQTLSSLARQQTFDTRPVVLPSLSAGGEPHADVNALLGAWAKLWLHGVEGTGDGFYQEDQRRRIPLPGYPFERQRYRIEPVQRHESRGDWGESSASRDIARWFYYPCWKPALPLHSKQEQSDDGRKRWLILGGNGLGSQLARALRQRGEDVIGAVMGERFASLGPGAYSLRPHVKADYEALLQEEMPRGLPDVIVHMWSVTAPNDEQPDDEDFGRYQELGFHSLVRLVQALENHYAASPIRITVVSSQIEAVNGVERLCPAKATVLGACRVIPQEYPNLRCQLVDVDPSESKVDSGSALAGHLITELTAAPLEPVVAWRHGRRWVQAFEAVRLELAGGTTPRLRPGGVYLITGGLGRIGLVLAGFLARHARAKLVLTGRSELPERREWQRWVKGSSREVIGSRIRKLLELEKLGAEVFIAKADVADRNDMRRVLAEAEGRFGPIHGVIHGAGDTEAISPVAQTGIEAAAEQFRAKAIGLMVLDELLRGRELDFVMLLSSLASVLGGLGLAAYAAANIFLDTFASERNREGAVPWISVNWDAWQFPTAEGGEIADDSILPDEGEEAFRRILERAPPQVVVSVSDLEARLDQWIRFDGRHQSTPPAQELAPQHARPDLTVAYAPPRSAAETTLVEIWQDLLGVIPVGIFDNFFDLGGHSLLAIQLISRIREVFRTECSVHKVFETPTIAELALGIAAEHGRTDEARTAQILDLVEQLSDTEIAALLDGDGSTPSAKMH